MITFDYILQGDDATEQNAIDTANGLDWPELDSSESDIKYSRYIETVNGVDIYYDYGADYYFFAEPDLSELHKLFVNASDALHRIDDPLSDNYQGITDLLIRLANKLSETETDESVWWWEGRGDCSLSDLIVAAYWHYTHYHEGQNSKGYQALSALSDIYSPGMECEPEPDSSEHWIYSELNRIAEL